MLKKFSAYRIYLLYSCLVALFSSMVSVVMAVYQVETIHLSPLELVLAGTVFEASCFLSQIPTGVVADLYSRKLSILIGAALTGLAFLIQGSFPNYACVLISQILWGIGSTFTDGALEAWIAEEESTRDLNNIYLRGAQFGQIGSVAGIALGTVLGNLSLSLPICLGGAMLLTFCLFLALYLPEFHFHSAAPEELKTVQKMGFTLRSGIKVIQSKTVLITLMLIALFSGLASEGYDRLNTAHFLQDTTLPQIGNLKPVTWFGIFGILQMLLGILLMQLFLKRCKINGTRQSAVALLIINLCYILSMLLFGATVNFGFMLTAYLSINILKTINRPILTSLLSSQAEGDFRATILSTNEQANSLGEILGGPAIGIIADRVSIGFGISATVIFLIPIAFLLFHIKGRKRNSSAV